MNIAVYVYDRNINVHFRFRFAIVTSTTISKVVNYHTINREAVIHLAVWNNRKVSPQSRQQWNGRGIKKRRARCRTSGTHQLGAITRSHTRGRLVCEKWEGPSALFVILVNRVTTT